MLDGRVYIVTGGATGIGAGITRVLTDYGATVAVFQPDGSHSDAVVCDVRDPAAVEQCVQMVAERHGRLDGIVNNAAITGPPALAPFLDATPDHVEEVLAVNVKGPIFCSQSVARYCAGRGHGGAIVNIASVGSFATQELASVYCASKAAVTMLTKGMALELAPFGIRVNAVAPGDIATPASASVLAEAKAKGASGHYRRQTPVGRRGTPEEIGEAVAFLLSDRAAFITGETLVVDGGFLTY